MALAAQGKMALAAPHMGTCVSRLEDDNAEKHVMAVPGGRGNRTAANITQCGRRSFEVGDFVNGRHRQFHQTRLFKKLDALLLSKAWKSFCDAVSSHAVKAKKDVPHQD